MSISQVVKYVTSNGDEFTDKREAQLREIQLETEEELRKVLTIPYNTGRAEAIILSMVRTNADMVRAILAKYCQRTNRMKKTETEETAEAA